MTGPELTNFSFASDRVVACVSNRIGGVSSPPWDSLNMSFGVGDDPDAVLENRVRACAAIGFPLDALTVANQIHGGEVVIVDERHRGRGARRPSDAIADADALVTAEPDVLLGVLLADCVPVVLHDPERSVVAIAHAGWRGTVAHVVRNTIRTMVEQFSCRPIDIVAGIGPSIGPASYEVGEEVTRQASVAFADAPDVLHTEGRRITFDLWAANAFDLRSCGLLTHNVELLGIDTFTTTNRWFSHRAGAPTGRFMAFTALRR